MADRPTGRDLGRASPRHAPGRRCSPAGTGRRHDAARLERRADDLLDELGPAGHEEQHLGPHREGDRVAIHQDRPEPIAQRRAARVAARDDVESPIAEPVRQPGRLRRLAPAVRAVQHQEESGMRTGTRPVTPTSAAIVVGPPGSLVLEGGATRSGPRMGSPGPPRLAGSIIRDPRRVASRTGRRRPGRPSCVIKGFFGRS